MGVWFEGTQQIATDLDAIATEIDDFGRYCRSVVARLPGMTSVELQEATADAVTLKTNEGLLTRSGVVRTRDGDTLTLTFDEMADVGDGKLSASAHHRHEFVAGGSGVEHRLVISDVEASGVLGALYRRFGAKRQGAAFLAAHRDELEGTTT